MTDSTAARAGFSSPPRQLPTQTMSGDVSQYHLQALMQIQYAIVTPTGRLHPHSQSCGYWIPSILTPFMLPHCHAR